MSELCLAWGALWYVFHFPHRIARMPTIPWESLVPSSPNERLYIILALAILLHPGFLILDSIHFQYNGFLFGLMLFSLVGAQEVSPSRHQTGVAPGY